MTKANSIQAVLTLNSRERVYSRFLIPLRSAAIDVQIYSQVSARATTKRRQSGVTYVPDPLSCFPEWEDPDQEPTDKEPDNRDDDIRRKTSNWINWNYQY